MYFSSVTSVRTVESCTCYDVHDIVISRACVCSEGDDGEYNHVHDWNMYDNRKRRPNEVDCLRSPTISILGLIY